MRLKIRRIPPVCIGYVTADSWWGNVGVTGFGFGYGGTENPDFRFCAMQPYPAVLRQSIVVGYFMSFFKEQHIFVSNVREVQMYGFEC